LVDLFEQYMMMHGLTNRWIFVLYYI